MGQVPVVVLLFAAAVLEAGGDAVIRLGIHTPLSGRRALQFLAGGLILFGYGYLVNTAPWDFGRLLGVYIVLFFVVAQVIGWLAFGQAPASAIYIGGTFILIGGAIISVSH
jgi:small multidrug resistance family-3 protein